MANKKVKPLTDTEIKTAKPREKEYTLPDGNGLQLVIKTNGRKVWEVRYTINSKPKQTTIGTYPVTARNQNQWTKSLGSTLHDQLEAKTNHNRNLSRRLFKRCTSQTG